MRHCYALFSGGFDSTLAILKVISGRNPIELMPVFFDYGQKSRVEEAKAVKRLVPAFRERSKHPNTVIKDCRTFKIESLKSGLFSWSDSAILEGRPKHEDTDVENRNMILISCLASIIMADWKRSRTNNVTEIITGFTNAWYDTNLSFIRNLNKLFRDALKPIRVIAPLIPRGQKDGVTPEQLFDIARSLNAYSLLDEMSWSCYYPQNGKPCKTCDPCRKRKGIFTELGKEKKGKP
jgi:7-cyano-7-deazaguanine synthase in queuosine biosynthesis